MQIILLLLIFQAKCKRMRGGLGLLDINTFQN